MSLQKQAFQAFLTMGMTQLKSVDALDIKNQATSMFPLNAAMVVNLIIRNKKRSEEGG